MRAAWWSSDLAITPETSPTRVTSTEDFECVIVQYP